MHRGSRLFEHPDGAWSSGDVGKTIAIQNAIYDSRAVPESPSTLVTTITAVRSPTEVACATAADIEADGVSCVYGTDDTTAIQAALTAAGKAVARHGHQAVLIPGKTLLDTKVGVGLPASVRVYGYGSGISQVFAPNRALNPGACVGLVLEDPRGDNQLWGFDCIGCATAQTAEVDHFGIIVNGKVEGTHVYEVLFEGYQGKSFYGANGPLGTRISNCTFQNAGAGNAMGFFGPAVDLTVENVRIQNLLRSTGGEAIIVDGARNAFFHNITATNWGIFALDLGLSVIIIDGCSFTGAAVGQTEPASPVLNIDQITKDLTSFTCENSTFDATAGNPSAIRCIADNMTNVRFRNLVLLGGEAQTIFVQWAGGNCAGTCEIIDSSTPNGPCYFQTRVDGSGTFTKSGLTPDPLN